MPSMGNYILKINFYCKFSFWSTLWLNGVIQNEKTVFKLAFVSAPILTSQEMWLLYNSICILCVVFIGLLGLVPKHVYWFCLPFVLWTYELGRYVCPTIWPEVYPTYWTLVSVYWRDDDFLFNKLWLSNNLPWAVAILVWNTDFSEDCESATDTSTFSLFQKKLIL